MAEDPWQHMRWRCATRRYGDEEVLARYIILFGHCEVLKQFVQRNREKGVSFIRL